MQAIRFSSDLSGGEQPGSRETSTGADDTQPEADHLIPVDARAAAARPEQWRQFGTRYRGGKGLKV